MKQTFANALRRALGWGFAAVATVLGGVQVAEVLGLADITNLALTVLLAFAVNFVFRFSQVMAETLSRGEDSINKVTS